MQMHDYIWAVTLKAILVFCKQLLQVMYLF